MQAFYSVSSKTCTFVILYATGAGVDQSEPEELARYFYSLARHPGSLRLDRDVRSTFDTTGRRATNPGRTPQINRGKILSSIDAKCSLTKIKLSWFVKLLNAALYTEAFFLLHLKFRTFQEITI